MKSYETVLLLKSTGKMFICSIPNPTPTGKKREKGLQIPNQYLYSAGKFLFATFSLVRVLA